MLIDELLSAKNSPQWLVRNVLPRIFHVVRPTERGGLGLLLNKIKSDPSSLCKEIIYPTVEGHPLPDRFVRMIVDIGSWLNVKVTGMHIDYSPDGVAFVPESPNSIWIGEEYVVPLCSIDRTDEHANNLYDYVYKFMGMNFSDRKIECIVSLAFEKLTFIYTTVDSMNDSAFLSLFRAVFIDIARYKDMVLLGTTEEFASCPPESSLFVASTMDALMAGINSIRYSRLDNGTIGDDVVVDAMVSERLLYWNFINTLAIPSNVRDIVADTITKYKCETITPIDKLSSIASARAAKIVSGDITEPSTAVKSFIPEVILEVAPTSTDVPKSPLSPKRPAPHITPSYIQGHLFPYIDDLEPSDISFDIPEERLSMLIHDLGEGSIAIKYNGNNAVHYYEDGADEYKLFMVKDSARIVYGMNTDKWKPELVRFSDNAPKWEYVFKY